LTRQRPAPDDARALTPAADKLGRLAQAFATGPATGQPVRLIDVAAPPNQDSGSAGSSSPC